MIDPALKERLENLEESKLLDFAQNYRQYGYKEEVRDYILELLSQKGISTADLKLMGKYENENFNAADATFNAYKKHSLAALICWLLFVGIGIFHNIAFVLLGIVALPVYLLLPVLFFFFLIRSFLDQSAFYKITDGDASKEDGALMFAILGIIAYAVMYFIYLKQMKERLAGHL